MDLARSVPDDRAERALLVELTNPFTIRSGQQARDVGALIHVRVARCDGFSQSEDSRLPRPQNASPKTYRMPKRGYGHGSQRTLPANWNAEKTSLKSALEVSRDFLSPPSEMRRHVVFLEFHAAGFVAPVNLFAHRATMPGP